MASSNVVSIQNNPFFKANARRTIQGQSKLMTDIVAQNILTDYSANGVRTGNITIIGADVYNTKNVLKKKWDNGNIINVNDIVKIVDSNGDSIMNFLGQEVRLRVIGRVVKYNGEPTIKLELMEIKE